MADVLVKELGVEDLYGFLEVPSDATDKEVRILIIGSILFDTYQ